MSARNVHVEELLGRRIYDANGEFIGRLEEIRAKVRGRECVVEEYHVGPAALLERLGLSAAKFVGLPLPRRPWRVPWDQLDLSDPEHLRLHCTSEELKKMTR